MWNDEQKEVDMKNLKKLENVEVTQLKENVLAISIQKTIHEIRTNSFVTGNCKK